MAGELLRRVPGRWPTLSDMFEDFPFELRSPMGEHPIRIEEAEEEGAYVVRAELPGIDPDRDVDITLDDDVLTVHAERREERKEKHRSEFRYGEFTRSVRLPAGVTADDVTASYADGVLTVRAPLPAETPRAKRRIEVARGDEPAA
ncbi:Hsp20/alpha crystallin family protein [Streptomyces sp. JJ36]|uniref:Hsp20/alpha crystallin family protein n=1 Tax=Streptomyces sp. JJ36 TaxID=2736645 RepID=UPI001F2443FB|nr:Hsp20/alpha crystallin family protein [Streptomyces sp. JJ36]MCF6522704.1 Hsp20/alpha crystallin family protein [Streptomyces sp. JJ36]